MKHPIVAAQTQARPTVSELRKEHTVSDTERLLKRGMVPGAVITESSGTVLALLVVVNVRGHEGLPPALFGDSCLPGMLHQASLVLVNGMPRHDGPRLATIMTAGLLTGFWRLMRNDSST